VLAGLDDAVAARGRSVLQPLLGTRGAGWERRRRVLRLLRHLGAEARCGWDGEGDPRAKDLLGLCVLSERRVFWLASSCYRNQTPVRER